MRIMNEKIKSMSHFIIPALIMLLGFLARAWWIRTIPTEQLYDFDAYYRIAVNIFEGKGFTYEGEPIAFQGMFYSWFLGLIFKLFGTASIALAKWMNIAYSMGMVLISWRIVLKLTQGLKNSNNLALITMAFVAFLPQHIAYCNTTGTEIMMGFLLALLIWVQLSDLKDNVKYPILGILTGLCALTKPFYMAFPIIIAVSEWMMSKDWKKTLLKGAVVWLIMAAVIAPWAMRNYKAYGRFIAISYNSGFNLYINNNANNIHGGWMSFDDIYKTPELQEKINMHLENGNKSVKLASDIELDFKPPAMEWIKENPIEFMKLGLIRIHSTYFNGSWDVDAWTMNQLRDKPTDKTQIEVSRNFNGFRAINDITLGVVSGFSFIFILLGIPSVFMSIISFKKTLNPSVVLPFMNLAFPSIVFFVYEGQPRYNQSLLFIMIIVFVLSANQMMSLYTSSDDKV